MVGKNAIQKQHLIGIASNTDKSKLKQSIELSQAALVYGPVQDALQKDEQIQYERTLKVEAHMKTKSGDLDSSVAAANMYNSLVVVFTIPVLLQLTVIHRAGAPLSAEVNAFVAAALCPIWPTSTMDLRAISSLIATIITLISANNCCVQVPKLLEKLRSQTFTMSTLSNPNSAVWNGHDSVSAQSLWDKLVSADIPDLHPELENVIKNHDNLREGHDLAKVACSMLHDQPCTYMIGNLHIVGNESLIRKYFNMIMGKYDIFASMVFDAAKKTRYDAINRSSAVAAVTHDISTAISSLCNRLCHSPPFAIGIILMIVPILIWFMLNPLGTVFWWLVSVKTWVYLAFWLTNGFFTVIGVVGAALSLRYSKFVESNFCPYDGPSGLWYHALGIGKEPVPSAECVARLNAAYAFQWALVLTALVGFWITLYYGFLKPCALLLAPRVESKEDEATGELRLKAVCGFQFLKWWGNRQDDAAEPTDPNESVQPSCNFGGSPPTQDSSEQRGTQNAPPQQKQSDCVISMYSASDAAALQKSWSFSDGLLVYLGLLSYSQRHIKKDDFHAPVDLIKAPGVDKDKIELSVANLPFLHSLYVEDPSGVTRLKLLAQWPDLMKYDPMARKWTVDMDCNFTLDPSRTVNVVTLMDKMLKTRTRSGDHPFNPAYDMISPPLIDFFVRNQMNFDEFSSKKPEVMKKMLMGYYYYGLTYHASSKSGAVNHMYALCLNPHAERIADTLVLLFKSDSIHRHRPDNSPARLYFDVTNHFSQHGVLRARKGLTPEKMWDALFSAYIGHAKDLFCPGIGGTALWEDDVKQELIAFRRDCEAQDIPPMAYLLWDTERLFTILAKLYNQTMSDTDKQNLEQKLRNRDAVLASCEVDGKNALPVALGLKRQGGATITANWYANSNPGNGRAGRGI